jgi:hypothetical protein
VQAVGVSHEAAQSISLSFSLGQLVAQAKGLAGPVVAVASLLCGAATEVGKVGHAVSSHGEPSKAITARPSLEGDSAGPVAGHPSGPTPSVVKARHHATRTHQHAASCTAT